MGLNNKDQDPKQTSIKQLRALSRQAESTFPNAIVYFPIMNFSPNLTRQQQDNLKLLNNHIADKHYSPTRPTGNQTLPRWTAGHNN